METKHEIVRILRNGKLAWGAKTAHGWLTYRGENPEELKSWLALYDSGSTEWAYTPSDDVVFVDSPREQIIKQLVDALEAVLLHGTISVEVFNQAQAALKLAKGGK